MNDLLHPLSRRNQKNPDIEITRIFQAIWYSRWAGIYKTIAIVQVEVDISAQPSTGSKPHEIVYLPLVIDSEI